MFWSWNIINSLFSVFTTNSHIIWIISNSFVLGVILARSWRLIHVLWCFSLLTIHFKWYTFSLNLLMDWIVMTWSRTLVFDDIIWFSSHCKWLRILPNGFMIQFILNRILFSIFIYKRSLSTSLLRNKSSWNFALHNIMISIISTRTQISINFLLFTLSSKLYILCITPYCLILSFILTWGGTWIFIWFI